VHFGKLPTAPSEPDSAWRWEKRRWAQGELSPPHATCSSLPGPDAYGEALPPCTFGVTCRTVEQEQEDRELGSSRLRASRHYKAMRGQKPAHAETQPRHVPSGAPLFPKQNHRPPGKGSKSLRGSLSAACAQKVWIWPASFTKSFRIQLLQ